MVRYVGYIHQNIHLEYQAIKPHIVFPQELSHFSRFSVCSDEKRLQWQREDTALMSCVSKHGVGSGVCMLVCLCATPSVHLQGQQRTGTYTVGSNGTESHLPHFPPNLSFIGLFECTECDSKATSDPPSLWIQATCWVCSPPDGTPNSPHFPSYHWEVPILHRAERTSTETKSCVNLWAPLAVTDQGLWKTWYHSLTVTRERNRGCVPFRSLTAANLTISLYRSQGCCPQLKTILDILGGSLNNQSYLVYVHI